jgi:meckelin
MGCLYFVALLWTLLSTWKWNKRAGKFACDIVSLFKFVSFFVTGIGYCFWLGMVGVPLFYFIAYHGQTETVVFLPMRNQEKNIRALVVTTFALKLVDVLNLIFVQTSYDIFFIDWERPKAEHLE